MSDALDTSLPGMEADLGQVHVTTEDLARLYGVTVRAVQLWETERGWIRRAPRGTFPLVEAVKGVYDGQAAAINKKKGPEGAELDNLELREQKAKTEKAEIEVQRLRDELIPAAEVEKEIFERYRTVRDALENIPARVAAGLAAETDEHTIKTLLVTEINRILETLSA